MSFIPKGTRCDSKTEFASLIRRWYHESDEKTIGALGNAVQGRTPWIIVRTGGREVRVHADSTRDAMRRYLEVVGELGPELPWRVQHTQRGTLNKVCFESNGTPTKGFFAYTMQPQAEPVVI